MTLSDGSAAEVEYINHNRLLRETEECVGVKTGFTKDAGRCLVSASDYNGMQYIIVTLNDPDDWNTHKALYKKVMDSAEKKDIVKEGACIKHITSESDTCRLIALDGFSVYINGEGNEFEIISNIPNTINFPVNKGETVGFLEVKAHNRTIGKVYVVADRDFCPDNNSKVKRCFGLVLMSLLRNTL